MGELLAAAKVLDADPASMLSREEQWEKLQDMLSGVMDIMKQLSKEGVNTMHLGPQLVAALGRLTDEQYQELMDFDESETDPEIVDVICAVMLQAFVFVKDTRPLQNEYMERYLQRAQDGGIAGDSSDRVLGQLCVVMAPYFDRYKSIVEPLDDELKTRFADMALHRVSSGSSDRMRLDGAKFLARSDDPRATGELMRVFEQTANARVLRLTALKGLSTRADQRVLRFLRGRVGSEPDTQVLTQLNTAVGMVEKLVPR